MHGFFHTEFGVPRERPAPQRTLPKPAVEHPKPEPPAEPAAEAASDDGEHSSGDEPGTTRRKRK